MRRCRDLLFALLLLAPLALPGRGLLTRPAQAQAPSERWEQTRVADWETAASDGLLISNNAGGEVRLAPNQASGQLEAQPHSTSAPFSALLVTLDANVPGFTTVSLEIRTSPDGSNWNDWRALDGAALAQPVLLDSPVSWLQYRLILQSTSLPASPVVESLTFTFLDPAQGPRLSDGPQRQPLLGGPATLTPRPRVITVEGWGGSAGLRPGVAPRPRRVVVSTVPASGDPLAQLRLLQALDPAGALPYGFAVDGAGNIIQTRRPFTDQDGVVRVAFLGEPSDQARGALAGLIAWLNEAYRLGAGAVVAQDDGQGLQETLTSAAALQTVRSRWYFPEGNTRDFTERIMLFNPGSAEARARLTAYPGGSAITSDVLVPARERVNVILNDIFPDQPDLPIEVTADQPLVAEQTMLFIHDALNAPGIATPSRAWYFAEGSAEPGTQTYLLLFNPQDEEVAVEIQLMGTAGVAGSERVTIGPRSRYVYQAGVDLGQTFGSRIIASRPIVAARTMRFGDGGGHLSNGAPAPSRTWYFAEGTTEQPYTTTLALLNPGPERTSMTLTIYTAEGTALSRSYAIGGRSRVTLNLRDLAPSLGVAVSVSAVRPIVAERTVLFNGGRTGTNTLGSPQLAYAWRFAEGRSLAPATEYLVLANPNDRPARVRLELLSGGEPVIQTVTLARHSRSIIPMAELLPDQESHTTSVFSTIPIVAERTIIIDDEDGTGAHTSVGIPGR